MVFYFRINCPRCKNRTTIQAGFVCCPFCGTRYSDMEFNVDSLVRSAEEISRSKREIETREADKFRKKMRDRSLVALVAVFVGFFIALYLVPEKSFPVVMLIAMGVAIFSALWPLTLVKYADPEDVKKELIGKFPNADPIIFKEMFGSEEDIS
jgi:uncharacterized Zn finger protein (UPF0148 family)